MIEFIALVIALAIFPGLPFAFFTKWAANYILRNTPRTLTYWEAFTLQMVGIYVGIFMVFA